MSAPPEASAAPSSLLDAGYTAGAGYDELRDRDGAVRAHWRSFLDHLHALGVDTLRARWDHARQLLHDNGVSYNIYGDSDGVERPWNLSPLPVLLPASEWTALERGLAQRARLLDLLLADLYGPASCLAEGLLPPALVYGRGSFLRACRGLVPPRRRWLVFYAADLIRGPDGGFRVFADRTQAPSGAGYALENRIVISQVLPEAFREGRVERLARFFRRIQDTLATLAPHNRDNPRVVLMTPGPYNATYFEQAYLAQYLGYTLVTGADLAVRDHRVFLKTLGGLQPVDVILRRVHDDYCDPLELRPDTLLGVPALLQACRAGNVAVANALGTGLVRTPAIQPYLPALCRHFLGEDLQLPSVRTWWCGDPAALAEVEARFDTLVLKPAYSESYVHPTFVATLSEAERAALRERVRARPHDWVAQENLPPSTTPVLTDGGLVARPLVLRSFAVATPSGYDVMPGALARVAPGPGFEVTMQLGASSKDTWVEAADTPSDFSLLPPRAQPVALSRGGGDLPSRVADNLFWLGRYAERAEDLARTARVLLSRLAELDGAQPVPAECAALAAGLAAQCELPLVPAGQGTPATVQQLQAAIVATAIDPEGGGSVGSAVRHTLRVARMVRDRLSLDSWRALADLDHERLPGPLSSGAAPGADLPELLGRIILDLSAFSGLAGESMTRGQGWRFLDMGRRLERAVNVLLLLRHALAAPEAPEAREGPLLEALLQIADCAITYRRRYLAVLQVAPVVDLLVTDETVPRSVVFQAAALDGHLAALPAALTQGVRSPQERLAMEILSRLRLADIEHLCEPEAAGARPRLHAFLDGLAALFPALSDHIALRYLAHATPTRNLAPGASL